MKNIKVPARRAFWWTVVVVVFAMALVDAALWWGVTLLGDTCTFLISSVADVPESAMTINALDGFGRKLLLYGVPASLVLALLLVVAVWFAHRPLRKAAAAGVPGGKAPKAARPGRPATGTASGTSACFCILCPCCSGKGG